MALTYRTVRRLPDSTSLEGGVQPALRALMKKYNARYLIDSTASSAHCCS